MRNLTRWNEREELELNTLSHTLDIENDDLWLEWSDQPVQQFIHSGTNALANVGDFFAGIDLADTTPEPLHINLGNIAPIFTGDLKVR